MKKCDRCGAQLEDNAKFCTDCGAKQEPKKSFCSNCGTELNPNAKFCSECGTPAGSAQADRSEDKNRESATELSGIAQEIKEQGGIIVYNDQDEAEVEAAKRLLADLDPDMGYYLSDDFDMHKLVDNCVKAANLKFKKFGEPGRDIQEYGYPDDDYRGKIEYAILDDEKLILRGEGNTFRVLSDEAQKESEENFWVLNKAIRKVKDQIDTILVEGDGMSLRARLFKDFSRLETVILGNGVSGIRLEAFAGCPIKNVVLPSTMWHLVTSAFVGAKFKSFFIPPLSPKEQFFTQFQSDSIVDCKNLKYVFLPQRLFKARKVSSFFKRCDNLDADNVWEVKDLISRDNNLINNQKEETMEENLIRKEGDNGKYGYVDNNENWVIEPKFDEAAEFITYDDTFNNRSITLALVQYENRWGAIKPDGSWHISPEFSDMEGIEGEYEFVPTIYKGQPLEGEFDEVCSWMIAASSNNKWGIIDIDGNWIVEPYFEEIHFTPWDDDTLDLTAFYFNADTSININRYGEEI